MVSWIIDLSWRNSIGWVGRCRSGPNINRHVQPIRPSTGWRSFAALRRDFHASPTVDAGDTERQSLQWSRPAWDSGLTSGPPVDHLTRPWRNEGRAKRSRLRAPHNQTEDNGGGAGPGRLVVTDPPFPG